VRGNVLKPRDRRKTEKYAPVMFSVAEKRAPIMADGTIPGTDHSYDFHCAVRNITKGMFFCFRCLTIVFGVIKYICFVYRKQYYEI